ncbi:MAG: efflux transporter outer membrane subunit, partial [Gammaproteobacteria bacterium]|nr:efflux transporter outer membrane subunit [Gammaproteobacteria bacterium]
MAALVLTGVLAGCASGPDFKRPAPPAVQSYTAAPAPEHTVSATTTLGEAQRIHTGTDVGAKWWRNLGSPALDALIEQALEGSPTLAAAQATLRQAQEIHAAQAGSTRYPQVDADLRAQRQRLNPSAQGQEGDAHEFNLYSAGVVVRYQPDLSGGKRRALEALAARTEYRHYELEGVRLDLTAAIATTAITQARLAGQLQSVETILAAQDEQLHLTRERVRLGNAAPDEVLNLQAKVEQTRADVPLLRHQRQQSEHRLAVLAGRAPGAGGLPTFTLDEFTLPVGLPLVLPSELVRRRPDIQAAESLLHAANAEYGVSVANMYPQLNLSASLGSQALSTGALFGSGSAVWSLIGQLTQSLFNPGL